MTRLGHAQELKELKELKSADLDGVVPKWYQTFMEIDDATLFELALAASYMDIDPLCRLAAVTYSSRIFGMWPRMRAIVKF